MIFVKGGTFQMGSDNGERNEKPMHSIIIDTFLIDKYPVTQKDYEEIVGKTPSHFIKKNVIIHGFFGFGREVENLTNPRNPVEYVCWYDAIEYCNIKSDKEGLTCCYSGSGLNTKCNFSANGYRLPTEAEWEYAARGGNKSKGYEYSGSNSINTVAWCEMNSFKKTHPVGDKKANELGISDMSGNVWELCYDWYDKSYYQNSPKHNPVGPDLGKYRVLRGGSWYSIETDMQTSFRNRIEPTVIAYNAGFRTVRRIKQNVSIRV